jgi:hypothetical protein
MPARHDPDTIEADADTQANVQALLQLGMLLAKFVH